MTTSDATATNERAVRTEVTDGVARIALDRPPLNILDVGALDELAETVDRAGGRPDVKVVLLTARGRAFCAGVDVAEHVGDRADEMLRAFHHAVECLLALDVPVVAALNGPALGGGCELALAADIVLGKAGATLGQPEIKLGLFPPAAVALLPRIVGRQAAFDLLLSGRTVQMDEARKTGLVSRVLPGDRFEREVDEYVASLAAHSRAVLRLTKRALRSTERKPLAEALEAAETIYRDELMALRDSHEGLRAFLEKRSPVWRDE